MEYRYLGRSGLQVSALSLGAWVTYGQQVGEDVAYDCMRAAFDAGVNFFDNAEAYAGGKAEIVMGKVLKRARWKRNDLVISTKIFWGGEGVNRNGLSRKHILEGLRDSLDRLQLEYVDLIFCHRPDIHTPIEETVRAMSFLVDQGLAFYWGTSQWSANRSLKPIAWLAGTPRTAAHGTAGIQYVLERTRGARIRPALPGDRPGHHHLQSAGQWHADR